MVAEEFFALSGQFKLSTYIGLEDFADRLSFLFSVVLLIMSMMVVSIKTYIFQPLACYVATVPGGSNFEGYLENYCWVHGTIVILPGELIPTKSETWQKYDDERRITYYQWVPFILALQCIMFYTPRVVWDLLSSSKSGTNLQAMVESAHEASGKPPDERKDIVDKISRTIEDMLYQHRDYRSGKMAAVRTKVFNLCNFCVFSKHKGTWLVIIYMLMKCMYAINAIFQLWLLKQFLGFHHSMFSFGYYVLSDLITGRNWHETGIFPRVTYCNINNINHLGAKNTYVAQCSLPVNMLNEKIYVFLWYWIFFVALVTIFNIFLWFIRLVSIKKQSRFIRRLLQQRESYLQKEKPIVSMFIRDFLRHDGVFLIRMIFINSGDIVTSQIVKNLWQVYRSNYQNLNLNNCFDKKSLGRDLTSSEESDEKGAGLVYI